jgi:hypothetical protein
MKKLILASAVLMLGHGAFAQGTIIFNNRAGSSSTAAPGIVIAPVYGPENNDPYSSYWKMGNTSTGNPMGSQTYSGSPIHAGYLGATWTVTLWGLESSLVTGQDGINNLVLIGTTTFRTTTSGNFAGTIIQPAAPSIVPGVTNASQRGTFEVRVWDTQEGTVTTWDEALNKALYGYSGLFTVPFPLGGTMTPPNPAPFLQGLQSFNVGMFVPEPGAFCLMALSGGSVLLFCRLRKLKQRTGSK